MRRHMVSLLASKISVKRYYSHTTKWQISADYEHAILNLNVSGLSNGHPRRVKMEYISWSILNFRNIFMAVATSYQRQRSLTSIASHQVLAFNRGN